MAAKFTLESQKRKKKEILNVEDPKDLKVLQMLPLLVTQKIHCAFSWSAFINNSFENRST